MRWSPPRHRSVVVLVLRIFFFFPTAKGRRPTALPLATKQHCLHSTCHIVVSAPTFTCVMRPNGTRSTSSSVLVRFCGYVSACLSACVLAAKTLVLQQTDMPKICDSVVDREKPLDDGFKFLINNFAGLDA